MFPHPHSTSQPLILARTRDVQFTYFKGGVVQSKRELLSQQRRSQGGLGGGHPHKKIRESLHKKKKKRKREKRGKCTFVSSKCSERPQSGSLSPSQNDIEDGGPLQRLPFKIPPPRLTNSKHFPSLCPRPKSFWLRRCVSKQPFTLYCLISTPFKRELMFYCVDPYTVARKYSLVPVLYHCSIASISAAVHRIQKDNDFDNMEEFAIIIGGVGL